MKLKSNIDIGTVKGISAPQFQSICWFLIFIILFGSIPSILPGNRALLYKYVQSHYLIYGVVVVAIIEVIVQSKMVI